MIKNKIYVAALMVIHTDGAMKFQTTEEHFHQEKNKNDKYKKKLIVRQNFGILCHNF